MKKIHSYIIIILLCISLSGCKSTTTNSGNNVVIKVNGSTSMEKLINGLGELINREYPNISIEAQFTGSSAGIESVSNKTSVIGNSSRLLKEEEEAKGLVANIVAIDGIIVITNQSNIVSSISKEQLIAIYKGEIRNWNEIGGEDVPIVIIGREAASGTRTAFEDILGIENECKYIQEINEAGGVVAKVESIKGAIGYVSLDLLTKKTKALAIDGIEPTIETIRNGQYLLQRPYLMVTMGEISKQSQEVQKIFEFIDSDQGKAFIESIGLVPVS